MNCCPVPKISCEGIPRASLFVNLFSRASTDGLVDVQVYPLAIGGQAAFVSARGSKFCWLCFCEFTWPEIEEKNSK